MSGRSYLLGSLTLHIKMTQLDEEQCSFSNAGILNQSRRHALQESQGSLLKDTEATEIAECIKGTEIDKRLAWHAALSLPSPPPKEQEFVGSRCVSGSPVKSRLTGRRRGGREPGAPVTCGVLEDSVLLL